MSRGLLYIEYTIIALSLAIMAVITFANVLSRFIFDFSISFTEEVTVNLFVLLTFVGASVGIYKNSHLGFSLIYEKLNGISKTLVSIIIGLLIILFFIALTYYGLEIVQSQMVRGQKTPSLGWPQWVFTLGLPVGCILCIVRTLETTVKSILQVRDESVSEQ
ncbi:TRAP transporter small permease [Halobacillus andaensis]|uniref:TRAP transporter small permease n=1 Tax=Halobacillus andaensis TaxID=1176239 RepID=UPI003D763E0C